MSTQEQPQIPVVDLKDLSSPRQEDQDRAAKALHLGLGHYGLVYIRNHGINPEELDAFYDAFIDVTDRDLSEKENWGKPEIWFQRGWTPPNTEKAVVAGGQPDFKECYFIAPEPLDPVCALQYPEIYAENIWPDNADRFQETYLSIGHQLHEIGLALLRGCARALDLEPYHFEASVWQGPHVTRALRYLPLQAQQVEDKILWGEEHTDFNLLTLLPGGRFIDQQGEYCGRPDDQSGLYLRTRSTEEHPNGQMVPGRPPEGCIVAQVGQELEILTGGVFTATPHVIKAPASVGYSRVSMAHFIHLHSHEILFPVPSCQNEDSIRAYSPPVLAGTYSTKTMVDIGLAPAEALDKLGYRQYDRLGSMRAIEDGE